MLEHYANNVVTWKTATGQNEYGEPITTSSPIKCRLEPRRRLVRNAQGQEVVSEIALYTQAAVRPGDLITVDSVDYPVIAVTTEYDLSGAEAFREVAL